MPHDNQRMPESVVAVAEQATQQKSAGAAATSSSSGGGATQVQRYFRVPFKAKRVLLSFPDFTRNLIKEKQVKTN